MVHLSLFHAPYSLALSLQTTKPPPNFPRPCGSAPHCGSVPDVVKCGILVMASQSRAGRGIHSRGSLPTHKVSLVRFRHAQPQSQYCRVSPEAVCLGADTSASPNWIMGPSDQELFPQHTLWLAGPSDRESFPRHISMGNVYSSQPYIFNLLNSVHINIYWLKIWPTYMFLHYYFYSHLMIYNFKYAIYLLDLFSMCLVGI